MAGKTGNKRAANASDADAGEAAAQVLALLDDDTIDSESLNPALQSVYADLGIDSEGNHATVYVSKLDADSKGNEARVWDGDPDDYDLKQIARKFGSGSYRVKVYVRVPTGQKVLKGNKVIAFLLSPEEEAKRNPTQSTAQPAINPHDLAAMIANAVKAGLPPPAPPIDPLQQLQSLAAIVSTLNGNRPETPPPPNPLNMLRDVIELQSMLKGDSDDLPARGVNATGTDLLNNLINKFGPMLMQVLPAMSGQAGMPVEMHGGPILPAPAAAPAHIPQPSQQLQPQAPQPQQTQEDDVNLQAMKQNAQIKMGIAFLKNGCDQSAPPESFADVVLANVPTEQVQQILALVEPLDWFAQYDPTVKNEPYATWFREMLAECRELLKDDTEQADPPGP